MPDDEILEKAYLRAKWIAKVEKVIDEAIKDMEDIDESAIPKDLREQVERKIEGTARSWDMAIWRLVRY